MATDDDDAAPDATAELAELKPAVERLRGLLQAAAAAEEAAVSMDVPVVDGASDRPAAGGPDEGSADSS